MNIPQSALSLRGMPAHSAELLIFSNCSKLTVTGLFDTCFGVIQRCAPTRGSQINTDVVIERMDWHFASFFSLKSIALFDVRPTVLPTMFEWCAYASNQNLVRWRNTLRQYGYTLHGHMDSISVCVCVLCYLTMIFPEKGGIS